MICRNCDLKFGFLHVEDQTEKENHVAHYRSLGRCRYCSSAPYLGVEAVEKPRNLYRP